MVEIIDLIQGASSAIFFASDRRIHNTIGY